jgi:hypothetical protein
MEFELQKNESYLRIIKGPNPIIPSKPIAGFDLVPSNLS